MGNWKADETCIPYVSSGPREDSSQDSGQDSGSTATHVGGVRCALSEEIAPPG